ncbi:hypothetical protein [Paraburkholderia sp. J12]|uniref:hypothetical protein n=1 Tax=Paraburkholderia sp. J12 TaxID=2805432 RepID=UPI002ABE03B7|nr:hypothetical protein [Paraburkholderia sp. J12]
MVARGEQWEPSPWVFGSQTAEDGRLAEHVHDSVAHFASWLCALYEPRGVYCDGEKYYAEAGYLNVDAA